MNLPQAVKTCFQKYVTFSGRAQRSEYWFWVLFIVIASVITSILDSFLFGVPINPNETGTLNTIFTLVTLLPGISVYVRRLHDTEHSGWWIFLILIPLIGFIILLIWTIQKGTEGDNRFGADPLKVSA